MPSLSRTSIDGCNRRCRRQTPLRPIAIRFGCSASTSARNETRWQQSSPWHPHSRTCTSSCSTDSTRCLHPVTGDLYPSRASGSAAETVHSLATATRSRGVLERDGPRLDRSVAEAVRDFSLAVDPAVRARNDTELVRELIRHHERVQAGKLDASRQPKRPWVEMRGNNAVIAPRYALDERPGKPGSAELTHPYRIEQFTQKMRASSTRSPKVGARIRRGIARCTPRPCSRWAAGLRGSPSGRSTSRARGSDLSATATRRRACCGHSRTTRLPASAASCLSEPRGAR